MGTSTRWPGPKGGPWRAANGALGQLERQAVSSSNGSAQSGHATTGPTVDDAERAAEKCLEALRSALRRDSDFFGLRSAMSTNGERLVTVLDDLSTQGLAALDLSVNDTKTADVIEHFVDRVAGSGGRPIDDVMRRTTMKCAEKLANDPGLRHAVEQGASTDDWRLSNETLCLLYELFFADAVAQFIKAIVTAKINLLLPPLQLIDPAGMIPEWICNRIMAEIPSPCEEKQKQGDDGEPIAALARSLMEETVRRALGLPSEVGGTA